MNEKRRFFPWNSVTVGVLFFALVAILIVYGLHRRDNALELRTEEIASEVERGQAALARVLASLESGAQRIDPALFDDLASSSVPLRGAWTSRTDASGGDPAREHPQAWSAIAGGAARASEDAATLFARRDGEGWIVTVLPAPALEQALEPVRDTFDALIAIFALTSLLAAFALATIVRMRLWAFRAQETEQYVIAIRREGAKWKALTESAADMILIVDPADGSITERNRIAVASIGDRGLAECLPADEYRALREAMERATGSPGTPVPLPDLHLSTVDGRECIVDPLLAGIDLGHSRVVEISLRDVTRERQMERQLAISDRLSSLGLLTAGVAHEINNPLEGIGNYLSLLERAETPERRVRYLEQVRHGFERIRDLVRDLLSFARPGVERGEADLSDVVQRACKLVRYSKTFGEVEVELRGLGSPLVVVGDPARLEQVMLNLLINAATAMGGRGRIDIEARPGATAADGGRAVELVVDDQGPGIPEENLSRIFDPFFTTTQGTGLGLAISFGIVSAHGGTITASNRAGGGARFVVELPLRRVEQGAARREPQEQEKAAWRDAPGS